MNINTGLTDYLSVVFTAVDGEQMKVLYSISLGTIQLDCSSVLDSDMCLVGNTVNVDGITVLNHGGFPLDIPKDDLIFNHQPEFAKAITLSKEEIAYLEDEAMKYLSRRRGSPYEQS